MSLRTTAYALPSGQGIEFLFVDDSTNPPADSLVTNVVDGNERQSITVTGRPGGPGNSFTLSFKGQTTTAIPTTASPPYRYFQWNFTLPSPGTRDLSVNLSLSGGGASNQFYEILDGGAIIATFILNNAMSGAFGGPPNPTPFTDGTLRRDGGPLQWYPLSNATGRYTFATTSLSVRVSCNATTDGHDGITADSLRIATTDGVTVVRLDPSHPPGTVAFPGIQLGDTFKVYQSALSAAPAVEMEGQGAGLRYLADPAVVATKLQALSTVGTNNVTVSGDGFLISPLLVEFVGSLGGVTQPLLTSASPALSGGIVEVAPGGTLPIITINGGPPIPLSPDWKYYNSLSVAMPTVKFFFPQWEIAATTYYGSVNQHDNARINGNDGGWQQAYTQGYTDATWITNGGLTSTATYAYRPVPAGQYRVSATWPHNAAYSNSVTYTVRDLNGITLGTYLTNQTIAPSGSVDGGVSFQILGTFTLSDLDSGIVVSQSNGTTTQMIADTVRFERLSSFTPITIGPDDVVTWSAGASWASCQLGDAPAVTNAPVTNLSGGTLYPALPDTATMGIGYNVSSQAAQNSVLYYENMLAVATNLRSFPATIPGFNTGPSIGINDTPASFGADGKSWANLPNGDWVLGWDGASNGSVQCFGGNIDENAPTNYPASGNVGNLRYFTFSGDPYFYGVNLVLVLFGTTATGNGTEHNLDFRNAFLVPAGTDLANIPKFRADFTSLDAGCQTARWLDPLGAIAGNPTDFTDLNPSQSIICKNSPVRVLNPPVHDVRQYTGSTWAFDGNQGVALLITTGDGSGNAGPHGFSDKQFIGFSATSWPDCILADDLGNTTTFNLDSVPAYVYAIDANTFVMFQGPHSKVSGHPYRMTNTLTNPAGCSVLMQAGSGFPLQDMVEHCNTNNLDFYANLAFCLTDAALTAFGAYMAANLKAGLKLRHECSNEVWQVFGTVYNLASNRTFANGWGDSGDAIPFLCESSRHQWALVRAAWASGGRSLSDHLRVFGSQHVNSSVTSAIGAYCIAPTSGLAQIPFDEVATAPYLGNTPSRPAAPETGFSAVIARMTAEQHLDMWEDHYLHGGYENEFPGHIAALRAVDPVFFANVKMITYEGGPQNMLVPGASTYPNFHSLVNAAVRHPRWWGILQHIFRVYQNAPTGFGCTLFNLFANSGADRPDGPQWDSHTRTGQPDYVPGNPTQDAIQLTQFERNDLIYSVTGGAVKAWADRYNGTSPPQTLSAGTLTAGVVGTTTITCSIATDFGGTPPYSNQLQVFQSGSWGNNGSPVVGATAILTATGLSPLATYGLRVSVTDSASATDTSNTVTVTTSSSSSPPPSGVALPRPKQIPPFRRGVLH